MYLDVRFARKEDSFEETSSAVVQSLIGEKLLVRDYDTPFVKVLRASRQLSRQLGIEDIADTLGTQTLRRPMIF